MCYSLIERISLKYSASAEIIIEERKQRRGSPTTPGCSTQSKTLKHLMQKHRADKHRKRHKRDKERQRTIQKHQIPYYYNVLFRKFAVLTVLVVILYSVSPKLDTFTIVFARTHFGLSVDDYNGQWFQSLHRLFHNPLQVIRDGELHNVSGGQIDSILHSPLHVIRGGESYNVSDGQTETILHDLIFKGNKTRSSLPNSTVDKSVTSISTERREEIHNVAFLKIHKAASSTVQNILLRFGYDRNLVFVFPKIRFRYWPNVISLRETISENMIMPPPPGKTYNILCSHVLYNYKAFRSIMPNNTKMIGILRDPFRQFQSTLNYFRPYYIERIQSSDPVLTFLTNPSHYEPYILSGHSFTNNRMAFEFGFPIEFFKFQFYTGMKTEVRKYIDMLKGQFDLVLITEYFEESLVLMKRLLNWKLKDIIFLKMNEFPFRRKYKLHTEHRVLYERLAFMDYPLYYAFRDIMLRKITEGGVDLQGETLQLKKIQNAVHDFCFQEELQTLKIDKSKWNEEFTIDQHTCQLMGLQELHFYERLRKRQYPDEKLPPDLQKEYDRLMDIATRAFRNLT
ncbi:hypothetical protein FSP39_013786 [Pinctada imbricata]|uniref:Uncharacterized protein n=1 Tax=Pinctada imbricata TaxID=66713 RepID=A0AA89BZD5_PINIB|nr:hypothetical protein FSP39_013786 [Pinctada imbricata]